MEKIFFKIIVILIFIFGSILLIKFVSASIPITIIEKGNHTELDNLNWSISGHYMDTSLNMSNNNITDVDAGFFSNIWVSVSGFFTNIFAKNVNATTINATEIYQGGHQVLSNETILNVNKSDYWDNLDTINTTQMQDNKGVLTILESWLDGVVIAYNYITSWIAPATGDKYLYNDSTILYFNETTLNTTITSIAYNGTLAENITFQNYRTLDNETFINVNTTNISISDRIVSESNSSIGIWFNQSDHTDNGTDIIIGDISGL